MSGPTPHSPLPTPHSPGPIRYALEVKLDGRVLITRSDWPGWSRNLSAAEVAERAIAVEILRAYLVEEADWLDALAERLPVVFREAIRDRAGFLSRSEVIGEVAKGGAT